MSSIAAAAASVYDRPVDHVNPFSQEAQIQTFASMVVGCEFTADRQKLQLRDWVLCGVVDEAAWRPNEVGAGYGVDMDATWRAGRLTDDGPVYLMHRCMLNSTRRVTIKSRASL
jgi:hypothetical protein